MTPEKRVQTAVVLALGALPWCVVSRNNTGVSTTADDRGNLRRTAYGCGGVGAPDLLCEVQTERGWLAVWLECKSPDGSLSPEQRAWHAAARSRGRHVYTVRSAEEALAVVTGLRSGSGQGRVGDEGPAVVEHPGP